MYFSDEEISRLDDRVRQCEQKTGAQLVTVVTGKCDNYPEIPWKAFALGVALSALALSLAAGFLPKGSVFGNAFLPVAGGLAVGAVMALLTAAWPAWARCFLDRLRAEAEMRQHAQSLFLELDLAALPERNGILLLVGLFEHRMVILPDRGIADRLSQAALASVLTAMRPLLKRGDRFQALISGVAALEAQLQAAGCIARGEVSDPLPATLIERKGARNE